MTPDEIVRLVGAAGGATIIVSVLNAIVSRRKVSADVLARIEQSAGRWVDRQERRIEALEREVERLRARDAARAPMWRLHEMFDRSMIDLLRSHGVVDVPDPPPIRLPDE